jgi:hypothetical protein
MIVAVVATSILRSRFPRAESTVGRVLHVALPPNQLTNEATLSAPEWAWLVAWAGGLFALGMLVLRRRPLGED